MDPENEAACCALHDGGGDAESVAMEPAPTLADNFPGTIYTVGPHQGLSSNSFPSWSTTCCMPAPSACELCSLDSVSVPDRVLLVLLAPEEDLQSQQEPEQVAVVGSAPQVVLPEAADAHWINVGRQPGMRRKEP